MKKLIVLLIAVFAFSGLNNPITAQDEQGTAATTGLNEDTAAMAGEDTLGMQDTMAAEEEAQVPPPVSQEPDEQQQSFHQELKEKFIQGGWQFMGIVLVCLILGLAFAIERIISLNLNTINSGKLLNEVDKALEQGGVDAAKEICRSRRGPVASIFYQGLDRVHEGIDVVEKTIVSYGSVQMGLLERGMVWISLFISLAPMLGFMGTVIGMILAFEKIEERGEIVATDVAGGIKVALLTTLAGLIVAVILQIFYNYLSSKIDSLVTDMEDSSISLVDVLLKRKVVKGQQ